VVVGSVVVAVRTVVVVVAVWFVIPSRLVDVVTAPTRELVVESADSSGLQATATRITATRDRRMFTS
jgi:hypothetical protein